MTLCQNALKCERCKTVIVPANSRYNPNRIITYMSASGRIYYYCSDACELRHHQGQGQRRTVPGYPLDGPLILFDVPPPPRPRPVSAPRPVLQRSASLAGWSLEQFGIDAPKTGRAIRVKVKFLEDD